MSGKPTPDPWYAAGVTARADTPSGGGALVLLAQNHWHHGPSAPPNATPHEEKAANAARAVACVNACEGINPEAVPLLLAALAPVLREGIACTGTTHPGGVDVALDHHEFEAVCAAIMKATGGERCEHCGHPVGCDHGSMEPGAGEEVTP